jgi:hypothetical protein
MEITMSELSTISDMLLAFVVIGGPVLLAVFYVYGQRFTRGRYENPRAEVQSDRATREVYAEEEADLRAKQWKAAASNTPIDRIERNTGTSG